MSASKKAQWQRYIDDTLLQTEQVSMAAIHGLDGTKWATSENFEVSLFIGCYRNHPKLQVFYFLFDYF